MSENIVPVSSIIHAIRERIDANKERLTHLDSVMGDGDLGVTMTKAFAQADLDAAQLTESDVGKALVKVGMTIAKAASSTMGTLVATGFMEAGKRLAGKTHFGPQEARDFAEGFVAGIQKRGKAEQGEKTILDSVAPAMVALAATEFDNVDIALDHAVQAARAGLEATKEMEPSHGKSFYHKESGRGHEDGGALVGVLIFEGLQQALGS